MYARFLTALLFASATLAVPPIHAQDPAYSRKTLRTMQQQAHAPQDYRTLQQYFHAQAERFHQAAMLEEEQIKQEIEHPNMASKYPTPLGRARQLREYYTERSRQCRVLEAEYAKKAAGGAVAVQAGAQ